MKHKLKTKKALTGALGEEIACRFLMKHGFSVIGRNFLQKCGELDIIAKKDGKLHFIEVKTVSRERFSSVIHETPDFRPEDNIHYKKLERMKKTIQLYLLKNNVSYETYFQIDGVIIYLEPEKRTARVRMIEHINL